MKILHVVSSYWPAFKMGGPIQSVHLMNKHLAQKGAEITVFTTSAGLENGKNVEFNAGENIDGIRVFRFPYCGYIHFTFSPALFWRLKKRIKEFDIVHITGVWNFPVFAAAFWAKFYKKPYIISPRGSLMVEPLKKKSGLKKKLFLFLYVKKIFQNATTVHFTAEIEKEEYLKAGLFFREAIVVPNEFEMKNFNLTQKDLDGFRGKFNIPLGAKIVLSLGRISWKKGFDTLIPAFATVVKKDPGAVLVIVGPDEERYGEKVDDLIKENKLEKGKKVFFVRKTLVGAEKAAAYKSAEVFVLPSYSENFGMTVPEAIYFGSVGTAVVITKETGVASYIEKAGAGLVINKDINQLAEAISEILGNPEKAREMNKNGRKLIEKEFSSSAVADRFLKLYNDIYEGRIL